MKLQRKKLAILMVLLTVTFGFSQTSTTSDDTRDELKVGIKAGVNFSNVYDEQGQDFVAKGKAGFAAGGFIAIPIGKFFGVQPEIMYSQKGYKATGNVLGFNYDYSKTTSYLDIPILLQVKPIPILAFVAGPQFSYLLDTKTEFNGSSSTTTEASVNSGNYKKNIFGFVIGADLNIDHFLISGRAGWDISKSDVDGNSSEPRYKNQVIQLGVGFTF